MRIIAEPDLSVVVRVQSGDEPLVVVPIGRPERILHLARAVLDAAEFEALRTCLDASGPVVRGRRDS